MSRNGTGGLYEWRSIKEQPLWEESFNSVEKSNLLQSWAYGEAKGKVQGWRVERIGIESRGGLVAICQVLFKRVIGLPLVVRINRGPLFIGASQLPEQKGQVFRLLRSILRLRWGVVSLIAPELDCTPENAELLKSAGWRRRKGTGVRSAWIDLRPDESDLLKGLAPKWRNQLNSAVRSGLSLEISSSPEEVGWLLQRHEEHMKEQKFGAPGYELLSQFHSADPQNFLVLRAILANEPVAGVGIVKHGRAATYLVGWSSRDGRKLNAGNFLLWNGMLQVRKLACLWFDLGGINEKQSQGVARFKRGVRGAEYCLSGEWWTI
ncbi:MAG TPA: GNAT family N-acetyltransferase [Syntrophobacteraceae bacterium]|nr:GNAT family N-acetyltransferase [Syntrophobacteraceae bacterium]